MNMVTGLNVNIVTRSIEQTAFLGLQKAVDHVQKQLSEISKKYFVNTVHVPAPGIGPGSLIP
jgi:hypothetical protein